MLEKTLQDSLIQKGRDFMKGDSIHDPYADSFESDQDLKKPQPPLVKAAVRPEEEWISLPRNFETLPMNNDWIGLLKGRRSARLYTQENVSLLQLSFLLWSTQGIQSIRGKSYATLRTVPCGGARHEYETYLIIRKIDDLTPGIYHYLPMAHALEFLQPMEAPEPAITESLCGQSWAEKANVVFYWTLDAQRVEWRYGIYAHRAALIDAGHIGQNLYMSCTALGIGTCGIASFQHEACCRLFGLDGINEFPVYAAPVGTVKDHDRREEKMFYQFVEDEGL